MATRRVPDALLSLILIMALIVAGHVGLQASGRPTSGQGTTMVATMPQNSDEFAHLNASPIDHKTPQGTPASAIGQRDPIAVLEQMINAIYAAGSFKFQSFESLEEGVISEEPVSYGEMDITNHRGRWYYVAYEDSVTYCAEDFCAENYANEAPGSSWSVYQVDGGWRPTILDLEAVLADPTYYDVRLEGAEVVEGEEAYLVRIGGFPPAAAYQETVLAIDASTLLPIRMTTYWDTPDDDQPGSNVVYYGGWGFPVAIEFPAEALAMVEATREAEARIAQLPAALNDAGPAAVYETLLNNPLPDAILPYGFSNFATDDATEDVAADYPNVYGAVTAESQDGDHEIRLVVFPSEDDAASAFSQASAAAQREGMFVSYPPGFDYPSACMSTYVSGYAISLCTVQVGPVIVVGYSALVTGVQAQADTNAIDLARSGVSHLGNLVLEGEFQRVQQQAIATQEAIAQAEQAQAAEELIDITSFGPYDFRSGDGLIVPITVSNEDSIDHTVIVTINYDVALSRHGVWPAAGTDTIVVPAGSQTSSFVKVDEVTANSASSDNMTAILLEKGPVPCTDPCAAGDPHAVIVSIDGFPVESSPKYGETGVDYTDPANAASTVNSCSPWAPWPAPTGPRTYVVTEEVNVRDGPGTDCKLIGAPLPAGTQVSVLSGPVHREDEETLAVWIWVQVHGITGWVAMEFLAPS